MKLYKEITVDLETARARLDDRYTGEEIKALTALYQDIEDGDIEGACERAHRWPRDWREFIDCEVWSLLLDCHCGGKYVLASNLEMTKRFTEKQIEAINHAEANGYKRQGECFAWVEPGPRKRVLSVDELPVVKTTKRHV